MAGLVPFCLSSTGHVPGHGEVPSPYYRPRPACGRVPLDSVPRLSRPDPGI